VITFTVQSKDLDELPPELRIVVKETTDTITVIFEEIPTATGTKDKIWATLATAPPSEPVTGEPGVSIGTLVLKLKLTDRTIRPLVKALIAEGGVLEVGATSKGAKLYARVE
jgi:hypothetical protein